MRLDEQLLGQFYKFPNQIGYLTRITDISHDGCRVCTNVYDCKTGNLARISHRAIKQLFLEKPEIVDPATLVSIHGPEYDATMLQRAARQIVSRISLSKVLEVAVA
jgi:hypothetical protein